MPEYIIWSFLVLTVLMLSEVLTAIVNFKRIHDTCIITVVISMLTRVESLEPMKELMLVEISSLKWADVVLELIQTLDQIETKVQAQEFGNTEHLRHCLSWY
ncbi:hypothetical protein ACFLYM_02650 [Chloroflexota bacterium]